MRGDINHKKVEGAFLVYIDRIADLILEHHCINNNELNR